MNALEDTASWVRLDDPRTPVAPTRRRHGPWQAPDGTPLSGAYTFPTDSALRDGMALRHGWCLWRWRGPDLTHRHPMLSPWNLILGNALTWDRLAPRPARYDPDRHIPTLLLAGLKPYGYFGVRGAGRKFARYAEDVGLAVHIEPYDDAAGHVSIRAARTEPLRAVFDLPCLANQYRDALRHHLPASQAREVYARDVEPLLGVGDRAPADYLGDWFEVEAAALAVTGLLLGYDPQITAGFLIAERAISPEQGCYPHPPPNPLGDRFAPAVRAHLDRPAHADHLASMEQRGETFDNLHLETQPGLVHYAYRRCWRDCYECQCTVRCRLCQEPRFVSAAYNWLAARGITPASILDCVTTTRWATDLDDPDPGILHRTPAARRAHQHDPTTCGPAARIVAADPGPEDLRHRPGGRVTSPGPSAPACGSQT